MTQFLSLLLLFFAITNFERIFEVYTKQDMFDIEEINEAYCKMQCLALINDRRHISCDCHKRVPEHHEIPHDSDWIQFRTSILDAHNKLRNMVASGDPGFKLPPASDMLMINYDIELEYISRCFVRHYNLLHFVGDTHCLISHDGVVLEKFESKNPQFFTTIDWFQDAILDISNKTIASYNAERKNIENDVLLLIWSSLNGVGCSRVENPDVNSKDLILCLYRGEFNGGRIVGEPVYKRGPSCSNCPPELPCARDNPKYNGLCGEQKPVPSYIINLRDFQTGDVTVGGMHNGTLDKDVTSEVKTCQKNDFILITSLITVSALIQ